MLLRKCLPDLAAAEIKTEQTHRYVIEIPAKEARTASDGPRAGDRIRKALATPGRPGVHKIAERFGVNPGTVQRIARPFAPSAVGVWSGGLGGRSPGDTNDTKRYKTAGPRHRDETSRA